MLELFKAAAATQSVAALMLDFSNSLRPCAKDVDAINIDAIPSMAGRHLDTFDLLARVEAWGRGEATSPQPHLVVGDRQHSRSKADFQGFLACPRRHRAATVG